MQRDSFQFSLRAVFALVAFVGTSFAFLVAPSTWFVGLIEVFLVVAVPALAIVCAVTVHGRPRTFWIGVATATALSAGSYILEFIQRSQVVVSENGRPVEIVPDLYWGLEGSADWFSGVLLFWALSPAVGVACVVFHVLLFPRRSTSRVVDEDNEQPPRSERSLSRDDRRT